MRPKIAFILFVALALPSPFAFARFLPPDDTVPIDRLIASLTSALQEAEHPASVHAQLARVHSLAFAIAPDIVDVRGTDGDYALYEHCTDLPGAPSTTKPMDETRLDHLKEAIAHYRSATELESENPVYVIGLAYVLEQAAQHAPKLTNEDEALAYYRKAYKITRGEQVRFCTPIAQESAQAIIRILESRDCLKRKEKKEIAALREHLKNMRLMPRAITPIIFSLDSARPLDQLLTPDHSVKFDLDGLGARAWPWVSRGTVFLAWDADGRGDVTSGRQLIGSVTWWLFWNNGYEVLAALDDDGNGVLEGGELAGLAGWQDRNGNGVSDPGEVTPLAALGVQRLATSLTGHINGMPHNPQGLQRADGAWLPTYDWIAEPR